MSAQHNASKNCASDESDGWEADWDEYVTLPPSYQLVEDVPDCDDDRATYLKEHFLSQMYDDGACMFKVEFNGGWHVYRICPCGFRNCALHVIPPEVRFDGEHEHRGKNLLEEFRKLPVCTREEALAFWRKYPGSVTVEGQHLVRRLRWAWAQICKFPPGHELTGTVLEGDEMGVLQERYPKDKYKIIEDGDMYEIKQVCPCGKPCALHVLPSEVELQHSFKLVTFTAARRNVSKKVTPIEPEFRQKHAMTLCEAQDFFNQFPIKWDVEVTASKISFKMLCECGVSFENTPCEDCAMKKLKQCHICEKTCRKRKMKKCAEHVGCAGICSDCKAKEVVACAQCKKDVALNHECVPLHNMHICFKKNNIYPPLQRSKNASSGICPDCKKIVSVKAYHKHQYRQHSDLSPDLLYSRDYQKHHCLYCGYFNHETTNVTEHMKSHSTELLHLCKKGCGMRFARHSSEVLHRRQVHQDFKSSSAKRFRRAGRQVVQLVKRQRINYV